MRLKAANYESFYDFANAIVIADMKEIIADEKKFKKQHKLKEDSELLKAAKTILDYYTP